MIHVTDAMTSQVIDAVLHAFHTGPTRWPTNEEWNADLQRRRAEVAKVLDRLLAHEVGAVVDKISDAAWDDNYTNWALAEARAAWPRTE